MLNLSGGDINLLIDYLDYLDGDCAEIVNHLWQNLVTDYSYADVINTISYYDLEFCCLQDLKKNQKEFRPKIKHLSTESRADILKRAGIIFGIILLDQHKDFLQDRSDD